MESSVGKDTWFVLLGWVMLYFQSIDLPYASCDKYNIVYKKLKTSAGYTNIDK